MRSDVEQHSISRSVVLHLLPGVLISAFYFLVAPLVVELAFPSLFALLLAIPVVLIPFELGYLLYEGTRKDGTLSLKGAVLYRERLPVWQYIVLVLPSLFWAIFLFLVFSPPVDSFLIETFFSWVPDFATQHPDMSQPSQPALMTMLIMGFVFNGIAGPVVEELYFRGYLLPRISRLGACAPLVNVVLFSLYHFFTPWQNLTRILALLPLVYAVWWKRNIYLSVITHCALNVIGMLPFLVPLFG